VYEGTPTLHTAIMATVAKIAAFAAFYRLFSVCFIPVMMPFGWVLSGVVALTITIGNLMALQQDSFKRMLAFSGVTNAGYLMLAIVTLYGKTDSAVFYYSLAYGVASIAAFAVAIIVSKHTGSEKFDSFNGLAKQRPWLAVGLTIAMLSLAGIPPLAGFFGKYFVFLTAMESNLNIAVMIAIAGSLIGVYYYFRPVIFAFNNEGQEMERIKTSWVFNFVLAICIGLTLLLGIFPDIISALPGI
jgi:NADH-quinone oxidoreductase subunit N